MRYRRWIRRAVVLVAALVWASGCMGGVEGPTVPASTVSVLPTPTHGHLISPLSPVASPTAPVEMQAGADGPAVVPTEMVTTITGVRFTDLWVEMPEDWIPGVAGDMWGSPDGASRIGATWMALAPGAEPEAALLPTNSQVVASEAIETPLGPGRWFRVQVFGEPSEGEDTKADVIGVQVHVLVVMVEDDQKRGAYDLYAASPTDQALDGVLPVLWHMVATVKRESVSMPADDPYAGIPAVSVARTRLAEHLSVAEDAVEVMTAEAVEWRDACIGIRRPGQMCLTVITPGYSIVAAVDGVEYEVHTNRTGSVVGIVP